MNNKEIEEQAKYLMSRLQLKATGANIHKVNQLYGFINDYIYIFNRDGEEIEKKHIDKLIDAMERARQYLYLVI